jgi:hypothetical protein
MIMNIMFCLNMLSSDSSNLHFDKRTLNINHKDMIFLTEFILKWYFKLAFLEKIFGH